ncbi:MAG: ABC transporter permease [Firmicutes bacterium]|jgi:dipeptide/oligopeptide/nickel ABC transporter, permease protein|nr:ABC transporter permease [Clostridia bacterium]MBS5023139.1 ABC transporter permease [Bacillota bacterium]
MAKYILKRLLLMLMTLFIIMSICLIMIRLLPVPPINRVPGVDPILQYEKQVQLGYLVKTESGEYVKAPILLAYFKFWKNIFTQWNWGEGMTMYANQNVWDVLLQKLPYTVIVNLYSILIAIPLGLIFGVYAALKKNKWEDHVISTLVVVFISVPSYVYAFLVQYLLCFKLGWFPLTVASRENASFFSWTMFVSMLPAVLSLGFGVVAGLTRYTRAELSEVLTSEYMLLARTKGLTKAQAIVRHAMRNAMVVIFPMILGEFIGIMSGSLIIEAIFSIPGVGQLYIASINSKDYNFFMALTFFYTFIGLLSSIVIDISYGFIDPRIRMGSKK